MRYLLDTHIWVWWAARSDRLTRKQLAKLDAARATGSVAISAISQWEVANLVSLGRLKLKRPLRDWLEAATDPRFVKVEAITTSVAAEVANLPDWLHRDPADRMIMATSRVLDVPLFTLDSRIIDSGLVEIADI